MKDGEDILYYGTGEILSKMNFLDGKPVGEFTSYYESGEILCKCWYLDGKKHGELITCYSSGKIIYSYYINGRPVNDSEWTSYNRNIKLELLGL